MLMKWDELHNVIKELERIPLMTYSEWCLEIAARATPGPWHIGHMSESTDRADIDGPDCINIADDVQQNDVDFLIASRQMVPELARRLQMACQELRSLRDFELIRNQHLLDKFVDELESMLGGSGMQKHVLICYKNFSKDCSVSHIGLGVTAAYTAKTLRSNGYFAEAKPIFGADDLTTFILSQQSGSRPVTHVVICAQWIATKSLAQMVRQFPEIIFALNCHSNVGFLQAEPPAIDLVRQAIDLETGVGNFHASSNSLRLCSALQNMYGRPITFLPNLYWLHGQEPIHRPPWNGGTLKIGAFGSLRVYKNFSTAVAAAIELTNMLKCHSEIWINSGRDDGAGNIVYQTALSWTRGLPNVVLKEFHWASWPDFKRMIGSMNILFQPSYTETFNNVTADGVAEGVPSVVSDAIDWVPKTWIAESDDCTEVASIARQILFDPRAPLEGYQALKNYVAKGLPYWKEFISRGE